MPFPRRGVSRRRPPFLTAVVAATALVAFSSCAGGNTAIAPLPPPPRTSALPPTTAPPDYSGVALPVVSSGRTTTTALPMGPGRATLNGRVVGPDGIPAGGAKVRVERLVGGAVATTDLVTDAEGKWTIPTVLGGRYRARAWRSPDHTVLLPALFFVAATDTVPVDIMLERHFGTTPIPAVAPSRPMVGQPTNLVVQVTSRSVDADGLVQGAPMAGATVALSPGGAWTVGLPNPTVTDASGRGRWELVCGATGAQPLRLVVNDVEQFQLALPACVEPPPPPSAAPGSTVAPKPTATTRAGATSTTTATTRPPATATTRPPTTRPR